jgi:hypothetical protein
LANYIAQQQNTSDQTIEEALQKFYESRKDRVQLAKSESRRIGLTAQTEASGLRAGLKALTMKMLPPGKGIKRVLCNFEI